MPQTRVTSTGQIQLPSSILKYLDLHAGDRVDFQRTADGRVVLIKVGVERPPPLIRTLGKGTMKNIRVAVDHDGDGRAETGGK